MQCRQGTASGPTNQICVNDAKFPSTVPLWTFPATKATCTPDDLCNIYSESCRACSSAEGFLQCGWCSEGSKGNFTGNACRKGSSIVNPDSCPAVTPQSWTYFPWGYTCPNNCSAATDCQACAGLNSCGVS